MMHFGNKQILKKWVTIIHLIGLITLLTISCMRTSEKIVVWSSMRPVERALLDTLLHEFSTSYPQYRFVQLFYAPEEARTNFIISSLAGKGPALIHGANDNIGPFVELDVIQPLEAFFSKTELDSFLDSPFPANTYFKGHLFQIADRVGNHLCLIYNKRLVKKPPQTMSELIAMGQKLTVDKNGDGKPERYAIAWNYTEPFFFIPFITGYGGWLFDENYHPTLNTEATKKAAQLIYNLVNKYKIMPKEADYEIANALFKDGLSAMIINGPWSFATYLRNNIPIGIARIPKIDETGLWPAPLVSPMGYSLNKNLTGQKRRVAVKLLKYLTSEEVQLRFIKLSGTIPSLKTAFKDSLVQNNELIRSALDQLMVGKPMPVITEMRWIFDAMRPAYQGIFTGQVKPEQAVEQMQKLAEKLIRENRE